MAHPQNNFTSQFQSDGQTGNAALTLNVNGENHVYTPHGNDQTVSIIEPVVFELSDNPTYSEVNEVIGQHIPCFIHVSGTGTDYMIPYVGQSNDADKLYFEMPDAQVDGIRYIIIRNGASPDIGVKDWVSAINAALPTSGVPSLTYAVNVSGTARYSENVLPYYVNPDNDKSWLEVGTYKANNSDEMYTGVTFAVKFRSVDGHTQCGFMWISVGEWKAAGDYTNADIVCEYYTLGRRVKELPDSVKLYVNILGTVVTDGVKIYAYLSGFSNISLTPLNVNKGTYTSAMTYLGAEPATKKEVSYCNLLRSTYGTAIGSSSTPVYVDEYGIPKSCGNVAEKASSGNGNLAAIGPDGNYASSGISAYDQSQINSAITNNITPWVENASYVQTQSFFIKVTSASTGHALQFQNAYTGERLLQLKLNYRYDVGTVELSLRMGGDNWNSWVNEGTGGGALVTANGTKHTANSGTDTVTPFFDYTETSILPTDTGDKIIGTFDIGQSSVYDTNSYYDFIMNIFNLAIPSVSVTLKITLMAERIASPGAGLWATLIGMATLDATQLGAE